MKVLFVNDFLVYAGAEKLVQRVMSHAQKNGHEIKLATQYLNRDHTPSGTDITKTIQDYQPDVVHFHNIASIGFEPLEYCVREKVPTVWTVHDWYPTCKIRTRMNRQGQVCANQDWSRCAECASSEHLTKLLRNLPKLRDLANHIEMTTLCNAQRLLMHDFGYDINHITVVKNGVDTSTYSPNEEKGYVFCFGVIRWEKAVDWHIQSANVSPYPHALAGVQIGFKLNLAKAKTKMLGFLPENTLIQCIGNASVVQVPARWPEPCGLTILESFACGKPVVSVAQGGIPEYLEDGKAGFLAEPGDVVGFIDLTNYLMDNDGLRGEMGKNALEASRYYSLERVWSDYEKVYKKAMN